MASTIAPLTSLVIALAFASVACSGATTPDVIGGSSGGGSSSGGSSGSSGGASSGGASSTPPAAAYGGEARGCSNVFVYKGTADGSQFITVQAEREKLGLKLGQKRTIDLATPTDGVTVGVDVYARAPSQERYCTDALSEDLIPTPWRAEAGTLVIELGENAEPNGAYRATVRLRDLRLVGPDRGTSVLVPSVELSNVLVGWLPG